MVTTIPRLTIQPLGGNHKGPDVKKNILVVCPNCHIKCDYGLIPLDLNSIQDNIQGISQRYIDYHNNEIHGRIGVSNKLLIDEDNKIKPSL